MLYNQRRNRRYRPYILFTQMFRDRKEMDGADAVIQRKFLEIGDGWVVGFIQIINFQGCIYF